MVTHLRSFLEMLIVGQPGTGENQWPQAELQWHFGRFPHASGIPCF